MDKLDRQVVRHKDKVQNHHHDVAQAHRRHALTLSAAAAAAVLPRRSKPFVSLRHARPAPDAGTAARPSAP